MTGEQDTQELYRPTERDLLELLVYKIEQMKLHWQAYFARKMIADKLLYDQARKDLNQYLRILKKQWYTGQRFHTKTTQSKLFEE